LAFLAAGGEMGALIRSHDWSNTSIGPPEGWPQALKLTVRLILNTEHPMYIWWGPELLCFYNDAYRASIGPEQHPASLGRPGREVWAEIWDIIAPQIDYVMAGQGSTWHENALVPITRHGVREDVYWTYSYGPIDDAQAPSGVGGVLVVCAETTEQVKAAQRTAAEAARLESLFRQAPGAIAVLNGPNHVFEIANPAYEALVNRRPVIGLSVAEALPEVTAQGFVDLLDRVYRTGEPFVGRDQPLTLERLDGTSAEVFLDFIYQPIRDAGGEVVGIFVEAIDVTDRASADALRREAESAAEQVRLDQALMVELSDRLRHLGEPAAIMAAAAELVGRRFGIGRAGYAEMDESGEYVTTLRDWTDGAMPSFAGRHRLADYGEGVAADFRAGRTIRLVDVADDPRSVAGGEAYAAIGMRSGIAVPIMKEGRFVAAMFAHSDAPRGWSEGEETLLHDVADRVWDATARARSEAAVRESEAQFRTFAEAMLNHVWTATPDGRLDWFNNRVYAYSGAAPGALDGDGWTGLVHSDDVTAAGERWAAALASGADYETEFRLRRADGLYRWHLARAVALLGDDGAIVRWVGTNTDIEEQKLATAALGDLNAHLEAQVAQRTGELMAVEEALRQSQKMEAVGQLTDGIAHDFNNLLAGISGSLEMLDTRIKQGRFEAIPRYIDAAQGAARRAAALTQRLLAFSRRQTLDPHPVNVNKLIGDLEDLIRRTVGPSVAIEVVGAGGVWPTLVDPNQLENAVLNLCINARDAMPDGGRLTIETANKWLDDRAARDHELPPGQYVSLCVTDTGSGMSPDVIARAFDPFFTTKPLGEGTGLGLSMIYGFVRQSGGQVRIYSEVGQGTTMCLYLPRYTGVERHVEVVADRTDYGFEGNGETVLVVDDEPTVRMLIVDTLEGAGYRVIQAPDGPSGLAILQSDARVDLLITDVGLPGGVNGRQIADAGRVVRPSLKVLFVTGYAENAVIGAGRLGDGMQVMTKPFSIDAFGDKVRQMLDD
jgi:PAS domain S-box-containing protein